MKAWIEAFCWRQWQTHGMFAKLLWPFSKWVQARIERKIRFYERHPASTLPVPVLVIGNIVAGGAGKTPLVIAIGQLLASWGVQVGVVSRGYARNSTALVEVTPHSLAQEVGDEPLLIKQKLAVPVLVSTDRVLAACTLLQRYPQIQMILSDDGLQHHSLGREFEICVLDERCLGNGLILPAGPLREPWPRLSLATIKSWSLTSVEHANIPATLYRRQLSSTAWQANGTRRPLQDFRFEHIHALAGIAQPDQFFNMLKAQGLVLQSTKIFPDHANFSTIPPLDGVWLCTEKDAVKLWQRFPNVWAVPLEVILPAEWQNEFHRFISQKPSFPYGSQIT